MQTGMKEGANAHRDLTFQEMMDDKNFSLKTK